MSTAGFDRQGSLIRQLQGSVRSTPTNVTVFLNSWVNYSTDRPARYWKVGNTVFLSGVIKDGTIGAAAFTLPAGFGPLSVSGLIFPVASNSAFGMATVITGGVYPQAGSNLWFSLDGIHFPVN